LPDGLLNASYQTQHGGGWTATELESIRLGNSGRRIVVYPLIGEAKDYRTSWDAKRDGRHCSRVENGRLWENFAKCVYFVRNL
jgi:endo-alpha-1,4-polygalactosaminidase (GH114 family)